MMAEKMKKMGSEGQMMMAWRETELMLMVN